MPYDLTMPRRLLLLITDLEVGGTPIVVRELALRLAPFAEVEVACLKPAGPIADQLRARGITTTSFEVRHLLQAQRTIERLNVRVRERRIDTVFSFLIHANYIAARAERSLGGVRFLQSIQTTQPKPAWHWWVQSMIHKAAARVVVPSESVALRAVEWAGVPRAKLVIVPNAIDVDDFANVAPHARDADGTFRVGFVGRLDPVKRVPDLIEAIRLLPDYVRLEIFGDGAQRRAMEALVDRLGVRGRTTFHGTFADVRAAYAQVDALVLPSEAEGFGLVLIEAMAAGVPVIGTDVDGIHDVVSRDRTGLLVPVADPPAIAEAITRLINGPALRRTLVESARVDVAQRFAWPRVIERYRELLQL